MIKLKRVYEQADKADGFRVLVERLWPRGISKERARLDLWLKDVSPSPELRKWFAHDPEKWEVFRARYRVELEANPEVVERLRILAAEGTLTLVYAASDEQHNSARILKEFLEGSS
jgi:uncharacterized protein YeaO (DUF488 family)